MQILYGFEFDSFFDNLFFKLFSILKSFFELELRFLFGITKFYIFIKKFKILFYVLQNSYIFLQLSEYDLSISLSDAEHKDNIFLLLLK